MDLIIILGLIKNLSKQTFYKLIIIIHFDFIISKNLMKNLLLLSQRFMLTNFNYIYLIYLCKNES